ncbi:MAG: hypothetical protein KDD60_12880, partial [Bdellovibrionales bacterium]|nr:hypothetical protein [Bdellovibrionales bacterium]
MSQQSEASKGNGGNGNTDSRHGTVSRHWTADLGANDAYIQEMYQRFLQDPALVGETWSQYFTQLGGGSAQPVATPRALPVASSTSEEEVSTYTNGHAPTGRAEGVYTGPADDVSVQERVYRMISAFRGRGHFRAKINPLTRGVLELPPVADIHIDFYHYTPAQLERSYNCSGFGLRHQMKLSELIAELETIYCGTIGFEFTHLLNQDERLWLQERIECRLGESGYRLNRDQKLHRLQKIIEAEAFESELHRKYVGNKRFSLQGVETVIPMLDTMLEEAAIEGVKKVVFGMPHRGRLNVLVNILGKTL